LIARSHDAVVVGEDHRLHAVAEAELREYAGDVRLDRRRLDHERVRDLGVREAAPEQPYHVMLARRERGQLPWLRRRADMLLDEPPGAGRGEQCVTLMDGANGRDQLTRRRRLEQEPGRTNAKNVDN